MSTLDGVTIDDLIRSQIASIDEDLARLASRKKDLQDILGSKTPAKPAPKATSSTPGVTTGTKTPPPGTPTDDEVLKRLEKLDWKDSNYGGKWVAADKVPSDLKMYVSGKGGKVFFGDLSFYLSGSGNLKRYEKKEAPAK